MIITDVLGMIAVMVVVRFVLWDDNNGCVRNDSSDGGGEEPHFDAKWIGPHVLYCREIEKRRKGMITSRG